ncbi:MAG TPA: hypothetical protein VF393_02645, partial [archaeon]
AAIMESVIIAALIAYKGEGSCTGGMMNNEIDSTLTGEARELLQLLKPELLRLISSLRFNSSLQLKSNFRCSKNEPVSTPFFFLPQNCRAQKLVSCSCETHRAARAADACSKTSQGLPPLMHESRNQPP